MGGDEKRWSSHVYRDVHFFKRNILPCLIQRLHLQLHLAAVPEQDVTKIQRGKGVTHT